MNSDTISKFRLFGKAGKIVMTVLAVIAAIITISCCIAAAFVAALPDNALTVRVVENTELRFNARGDLLRVRHAAVLRLRHGKQALGRVGLRLV